MHPRCREKWLDHNRPIERILIPAAFADAHLLRALDAAREEWCRRRVGYRPVARTETDQQAFGRRVPPEVGVLPRATGSMIRNHADTEDLVHDTAQRADVSEGSFGRLGRLGRRRLIRGEEPSAS